MLLKIVITSVLQKNIPRAVVYYYWTDLGILFCGTDFIKYKKLINSKLPKSQILCHKKSSSQYIILRTLVQKVSHGKGWFVFRLRQSHTLLLSFLYFLTCSWHQKTKKIFSNSPIHEFKVLQNVFKIKKQGLKCSLSNG